MHSPLLSGRRLPARTNKKTFISIINYQNWGQTAVKTGAGSLSVVVVVVVAVGRWWEEASVAKEGNLVSIRGRSLASSSTSESAVEMLIHEHRSSDAKKAVATPVPTQLATLSSFSHFMNPQLLSTPSLVCMFCFFYNMPATGRVVLQSMG